MKIAFIGAGRIASSHLRSIEKLRKRFSIELAGLYNPHPEKAERLTRQWGEGKAFSSVDELLDTPGLDAVYIISPTPFHYEQAVKVIERGYALYLEKPLTLEYETCEDLKKKIHDKGIIHCIGLNWRYRYLVRLIRDKVREGFKPALLTAHWFWFTPTVSWLRNKQKCGGQVFDQLVHIVDLYRYLAGDIESVSALYAEGTSDEYDDFENWDVQTLQFRFQNGAFGNINASYKLNVPMDERVGFNFISDNLFCRLSTDKLEMFEKEKCTTVFEPGETAMDMVGRDAIEEAFFEAVADKDQSRILTTIDEAVETMKVLFACHQSASRNRPVSPQQIS
jgi:predicted dehydrogenase